MSLGVWVLPAGSRGCEHIPSSSGASPFLNPLNQCHRECTSRRAAWFPKHLGTEPLEGETLRAPLPRSSPQRGSQEGRLQAETCSAACVESNCPEVGDLSLPGLTQMPASGALSGCQVGAAAPGQGAHALHTPRPLKGRLLFTGVVAPVPRPHVCTHQAHLHALTSLTSGCSTRETPQGATLHPTPATAPALCLVAGGCRGMGEWGGGPA